MEAVVKKELVRFSVIIPAWNAAETLACAIDSVLSQSWPAHEIIVVDDGSTDSTVEIAMGYGNRVKVIQQANGGVSRARNRGVEAASGNWLAFLDADDWYYPDRLRWHAEWILEDPGLDFLTGDYEYRDESNRLIGRSMEQHTSGKSMLEKAKGAERVLMEAGEFETFVADHFGDTHTLSVPRQTFLVLGGYPPGFKVCEDVHFLTRLCAASRKVGVVCRPMAVYRIHGSSATRRDPLKAQQYNLQTLLDLEAITGNMPRPVRKGVKKRLRTGRLNLAYSLVKAGRKGAALRAILPSLVESPGWPALRDVLSIVKG